MPGLSNQLVDGKGAVTQAVVGMVIEEHDAKVSGFQGYWLLVTGCWLLVEWWKGKRRPETGERKQGK